MVWRLRLGMLGLVVALLPATGCRCSSDRRAAGSAHHGASGAGAASRAAVPDFSPGTPKHESALSDDPLWKQAGAGDDIDLARLAHREGAQGLMRGVEAGGTLGLTGLRALPLANDAQLALRRLCEILRVGDPVKLEPVVRAVQAVISQPSRSVEQLDPEGMRSCGPVLAQLAENPKLPPAERDLASSARAMLAEHGLAP